MGAQRGERVVFVHAHPDDEAIFTGGTMALLAEAGVPTALVVATGGELGLAPDGQVHDSPALAAHRRAETGRAAATLGVGEVHFLGYHDSGMAGDPANDAPGAFAAADVEEAGARLGSLLDDLGAGCVVVYDDFGIYGHPDHVQATTVARVAAERLGLDHAYGATIDREHLHFVETHLVEEAALGGDLGLVRSHLGVSTAEVALTVDVRRALDRKRAAMAHHASQIPESTSALQLPVEDFEAVYGWEWFVRWGPPGLLDQVLG